MDEDGGRFPFTQEFADIFANPLETKAEGRRVVMAPVILFCDDTSGNRSKKWNKHESCFLTLPGLPFREQQLEFNVNFLCCSKDVAGIGY